MTDPSNLETIRLVNCTLCQWGLYVTRQMMSAAYDQRGVIRWHTDELCKHMQEVHTDD